MDSYLEGDVTWERVRREGVTWGVVPCEVVPRGAVPWEEVRRGEAGAWLGGLEPAGVPRKVPIGGEAILWSPFQ